MKEDKQAKTNKIVKILEGRLHFVDVKANGHIRVNNCDFWCTTEKWYDAKKNVKGNGLRTFIQHIEESGE